MVDISPFHGIRFNPEKVRDLSKVVTPPYDVIPDDKQKTYYEQHPNNVIRLDKNIPTDADTPEDNPHTRAAGHFKKWLDEKILLRDEEPSFYVTTVQFEMDGTSVTRTGLIAAVRLAPFSAGVILPHEETFSKVKSERLALMKACHANFSHIFSIYADHGSVSGILSSATENMAPIQEFTDDAGHAHKVWRIADPDIHETVRNAFENRRLFIADGHHRYETALNYRQYIKDNVEDFDDNHPANFIMMYLCAVEDPGLIILPTHRLLSGIPETDRKRLLTDAKQYFDIDTIPITDSDTEKAAEALGENMRANRKNHVIGLVMKNEPAYYLLRLKSGVMESLFADDIPAPLMGLDVTVLTRLVLMKLMGLSQKCLDDESLIHYTSRFDEAKTSVEQGENDLAFILNPPSNDQVRRIAEAGYTMPRKTTFYYPKVVTGQVMNRLTQ
ncbi:MAG: DUF1015 domain-containing protein [Thermodesulfobacteriota bacterium]